MTTTTATATTVNLARVLGLSDDDLAHFLDLDLAVVQAIPAAPAPADVPDELVEAARRFALAAEVRRQGWSVFDRARAELVAAMRDAGVEGDDL